MTQQQHIIRRKLNIVDLSSQLRNISEACRKLGVSRRHYYDIKTALEEEGVEGLLEKAREIRLRLRGYGSYRKVPRSFATFPKNGIFTTGNRAFQQ